MVRQWYMYIHLLTLKLSNALVIYSIHIYEYFHTHTVAQGWRPRRRSPRRPTSIGQPMLQAVDPQPVALGVVGKVLARGTDPVTAL